MKLLKWFGIVCVVLITLIMIPILYLTMVFDPNDYKPEIIEQVKLHTGRDLAIQDDLNWTFYPTLGIQFGGLALSNPQGFVPDQMLKINKAVAEIALMPLFSKEVDIKKLQLDGLELNLVTNKDGRNSFEGLVTSSKPQISQESGDKQETDKATDNKASREPLLSSLNIKSINITNTQINMIDQMTGKEQEFSLESFNLEQFSLGNATKMTFKASAKLPGMVLNSQGQGQLTLAADFSQLLIKDLSINTDIQGKTIPQGKLDTLVSANINLDLKQQLAHIALKRLELGNIKGHGDIKAKYAAKISDVTLNLMFGDLDLNDWLPAEKHKVAQEEDSKPANSRPVKEVDLSALRSVNLKADVKVNAISMDKLHTANWQLLLQLKHGILTLQKLSGDMYDGHLLLSAKLDARHKLPSYSFSQQLTGVQIRPLLTDAANMNFISGKANFSISGHGTSLIPQKAKQNLIASGQFAVNDGALYGVNIPLMIRKAEAKLKGKSLAEDEAEKTDFTSLTGRFNLKDAVINNPDLTMLSPLIRIAGYGDADIIKQSIDYRLNAKLVASLQGQGGKDLLRGIAIPLTITGSFSKPAFALDTQTLFNNEVGQKVKDKVQDELKKAEDKLKDRLLNKLGIF